MRYVRDIAAVSGVLGCDAARRTGGQGPRGSVLTHPPPLYKKCPIDTRLAYVYHTSMSDTKDLAIAAPSVTVIDTNTSMADATARALEQIGIAHNDLIQRIADIALNGRTVKRVQRLVDGKLTLTEVVETDDPNLSLKAIEMLNEALNPSKKVRLVVD